jgi:signal transduction histidine kinase
VGISSTSDVKAEPIAAALPEVRPAEGLPRPAPPKASLQLPQAARFARLWRRARGPIVAVAVAGVAYTLARLSIPIPDPALIFVLVVVIIATVDGSRSGLISGLILVAYASYADSSAGRWFAYTPAQAAEFLLFAMAMLAAALIAGGPRRKVVRLQIALRAQKLRLSEATRSKAQFMDAAAHELRTPLTVISGYVSMMRDDTFGRLPDRLRDPIAAVQRKTREINALIDEMLLSARVQRGTVPAATISLDVRDAVRLAVERAAPRVTLEQASLSYEVPSRPILTEVDPDHLGHILDNLINNALTYGDERPWVKITVAGGRDARVLVKDRGWGVPEAMREKIFERFVHYSSPVHGWKSGSGLGLSVSRELAERYGGSLELVRSEPGKGSLFVLRLPAVSR